MVLTNGIWGEEKTLRQRDPERQRIVPFTLFGLGPFRVPASTSIQTPETAKGVIKKKPAWQTICCTDLREVLADASERERAGA